MKYRSLLFVPIILNSYFPSVFSEEADCKCKGLINSFCDSTTAKYAAGVATGALAIAAAPAVLAGAGFTASGVAAGSLAASIQGAVYGGAATGMFSILQSAGAAGLGLLSKATLGSGISFSATAAYDYVCQCECET